MGTRVALAALVFLFQLQLQQRGAVEAFRHIYDTQVERGPLIRFQPSADETGTPLAAGAWVQTELSITVWLDSGTATVDSPHELVPVQVGVWLDQELRDM